MKEELNSLDRPVRWLTPCWSDWALDGQSSRDIDRAAAERPYRHWHLAVELAAPEADDVHRGAAIQKLWNAVESRVRLLHTEYQMALLKRVFGWGQKSDMLEVLNLLGLARPLILRQLKAIRNSVEHQDRGAPSHADCLNYIDSVWYFLRSTDIFASRRILSYDRSLESPSGGRSAEQLFVAFDFEGRDWAPGVRGRLPHSAVNVSRSPGAIELALEQPVRKIEPGVLYISGRVSAPSADLEDIVRDYFLMDLPDNSPTR